MASRVAPGTSLPSLIPTEKSSAISRIRRSSLIVVRFPRTNGTDGVIKDERRIREIARSEEHTSELQSHRDLHSFPTRRSSDLFQLRPPEVLHAQGWRRG